MARTLIICLLFTLALLPTIQVTRGQFSNTTPYLQVTLDKAIYYPGDSGTLSVDIKDTLSVNIEVYNISVVFPWRAYINGHWDGNQTNTINTPVVSGAWLPTLRISFIVPSDSRFSGGNFFGGGQGTVNVWASGVGSGGGPGTFNSPFIVATPYLELGLSWHTISYILIVMTILVGIMTGAVLYYVRASLKLKRASPLPSPPQTPQSARA